VIPATSVSAQKEILVLMDFGPWFGVAIIGAACCRTDVTKK
jgi:hypothetical protein